MIKNGEYTPEFKANIIFEVLKKDKLIKDIAKEYNINYATVLKWKKEVVNRLPELLGSKSFSDIELEKEKLKNKRLKIKLRKSENEVNFLKRKKFLISLLQK